MLRCEKCNKEFAAEESLNQHNKSKHQELYEEPKSKLTEKQKKKIRNWSIFIVIIGLTTWGIFAIASNIESCKDIPAKDLVLSSHSNVVSHIHPTLTITIDGDQQAIQSNIGVEKDFMRALHTHDATGKLHIESPCRGRTKFTLGEFFEIWGEVFYKEGMSVKMFVNEEENLDLDKYVLKDLDNIKLEYTSE